MTAPQDYRLSGERRLGVALLLIAMLGVPVWAMSYPYFAMGSFIGLTVFVAPPIGLIGAAIFMLWRTRHDDARSAETRSDRATLWNLTPEEAAKIGAVQNENN